ncbi:MAG: hypothetical protein LBP33_03225 [Candidatus Adiutrix sp.]|jgi:hypothetical protein|nr:hypothetical protein [Candidatus Adiutrix sp.]
MKTPPARRLKLWRLLAALVFLFSALNLAGLATGNRRPQSPAPELPPGPAVYRPDGGQAISARGRLPADELTRLNLGRRIDLARARPERLAVLPGLGLKSAVRAQERGVLNARERKYLHGLVSETCAPTTP